MNNGMLNFVVGIIVILLVCAIVFSLIKIGKIENPLDNLRPNPDKKPAPNDKEPPLEHSDIDRVEIDFTEIVF